MTNPAVCPCYTNPITIHPHCASDYTQALVAAPNDSRLLLRRAQAHQAAGADDAARADVARVLVARPTPYIRQRAQALERAARSQQLATQNAW